MKINVETTLLPVKTIIEKHGLDDNGRVTIFLRNEVERFCDPYVPMNTGVLKNTKYNPNIRSIKYISPYAHYMYKGKVAVGASKPKGVKRTISNKDIKYQGSPTRGAEWDKRMVSHRIHDIERDLENFIKRGGANV